MSDWKSIVATVAPGIATLLGGPLAGMAVKALSSTVLGKEDGTEDEVAQAIASGNPEVLARIKEAQTSLKGKMIEAGVRWEEIAASDRDSARKLATSTGTKPQVVLSVLFVGGYLVLTSILLGKGIEVADSMTDIFMVLIGVLTAGVGQIMNFWFGTSKGSSDKTAIMSEKMGP